MDVKKGLNTEGSTDWAKRKANAEGQARYREEQRRQGRTGRLIYLTEDEFNKVKRYVETLRAESS